MKKDRVQIDGVWYVREDQAQIEAVLEDFDPTGFEGYVVENDEVCFEATRIKRDDGSFYDGCVDIKFTHKVGARKDWVEDYWDNATWMLGVLNSNPESLRDISDLGTHNILFLKTLLQFLKDKEWL